MTRQTEMIEEMACRNRWDIPDTEKSRIVKRLIREATEAKDTRHALIAAKTLVTAEGQNQKDEHFRAEQPQKHLHLHRSEMALPQAIEAIQESPGYIDYLEQKMIEEAEGDEVE
ncbi:MAG: hypothetical protein H8E37_07860 [Planctomycetes bacterium]|nr:hypothetical protein [Planctomycetota bacterium]